MLVPVLSDGSGGVRRLGRLRTRVSGLPRSARDVGAGHGDAGWRVAIRAARCGRGVRAGYWTLPPRCDRPWMLHGRRRRRRRRWPRSRSARVSSRSEIARLAVPTGASRLRGEPRSGPVIFVISPARNAASTLRKPTWPIRSSASACDLYRCNITAGSGISSSGSGASLAYSPASTTPRTWPR